MTELDLSSELVVISGAAGGLEPLATKGPARPDTRWSESLCYG